MLGAGRGRQNRPFPASPAKHFFCKKSVRLDTFTLLFLENSFRPGTFVRMFLGQFAAPSFVFIYISGSTFIFNIFWAQSSLPELRRRPESHPTEDAGTFHLLQNKSLVCTGRTSCHRFPGVAQNQTAPGGHSFGVFRHWITFGVLRSTRRRFESATGEFTEARSFTV